MLSILMWVFFGLIVGLIAKALHPGEDPVGFLPTVGIGCAGSFVGGGINWLIGMGRTPYETSGFLMSIVGGVVCCAAYRWWSLRNSKDGPRSFFTGKKLR